MSTNYHRTGFDRFPLFAGEIEGEGYYPDGLTEAAIDALLQDVYGELDAEEHAAEAAFLCDLNDQRRAHRTRRRAGRTVLRSLPVRVQVTDLVEDEAA
ncbi:hypothetical protein [Amycolatopsis jiangsuensis]|uniref:Uncharacterized protein n=1 Tax=Amycolatopsis jiangsuensis TaxID=1181879 RepID=A0A840IZH6_9PSEU|nr:hypothetical protein [Amycolatopsis jiangsuensis]MBB4687220.1 hypothetical protein [Amycolatopsis jiangsuensis]